MSFFDLFRLAASALMAHRLRSFLNVLGIVVGITSVLLLTSLGKGTRETILSEFASFGTSIISIQPGKFRTTGLPAQAGGTTRPLTIEDAEALRRVPGVLNLVPVTFGMARVQAGERSRSIFVFGVTSELEEVWSLGRSKIGRFLPPSDPERPPPLAAIGTRVARELFGSGNPLGKRIRVGNHRFLVVGVMEAKGNMLGFDLDDLVYIPTVAAQRVFSREELAGIDLRFDPAVSAGEVVSGIRRVLIARHKDEDFTILTQTEMLGVLDRVLSIVGVAVAGIGGISLVVGAIGILTIMWISVGERTREIGVIRALGGRREQILALFLFESSLLSFSGGLIGSGLALLLVETLRWALPRLPLQTPAGMAAGAPLFCLLVGVLAGVLPARRAAGLDPIDALRAE